MRVASSWLTSASTSFFAGGVRATRNVSAPTRAYPTSATLPSGPMQPAFNDHFSGHARDYGRFRPTYPPALFAALAACAPGRRLAWDCATGNGQAAVPLADWFDEVVATDASAEQIARAPTVPRVRFAVAPAHASGLPDRSVDLVTVAQALHWFDLDAFWAEVRRVAVPGGVVAAWCYALFEIDPAVDAVVLRLYDDVVGADWPPERRHIESGYATLPWPWAPVVLPDLRMDAEWDLDAVLGYLGTWSATRRHRARTGVDPVGLVAADLAAAWGDPRAKRRVSWPLHVRAGRV